MNWQLLTEIDSSLADVGLHEERGYGLFQPPIPNFEEPFQVRVFKRDSYDWLGWHYYEAHPTFEQAKAACDSMSRSIRGYYVAVIQVKKH